MSGNKAHIGLRTRDIVAAYTLLRIVVGIGYFNIGFGKIGNIPGFMNAMVERMQDSFLPEILVRINAAIVPPVELIVGLLITIGLFTRSALIACFCLMVMLMYGITIIKDWDTAANQLIYNITLFILLAGVGYNTISIDGWLSRKRTQKRPVDPVDRKQESVTRFVKNFSSRKRSLFD
ncbi:MAG: DoxX family protein [Prochloraceae cyanobacterium]|nr:DoxX family protein [Prochloraceae cyanobacterium]